MQVVELSRAGYGANITLLMGMHRLRRKVFKDRLDWSVGTTGDLEMDSYDTLDATYLIAADRGTVVGCVRLLPTTGLNMLADTFPELLDGEDAPSSDLIAESSRFCVDTELTGATTDGGLRRATFMLFVAMLEWGEARGLASIATVTDLRMERILRRAGWTLERLGTPQRIGSTVAVAGLLPIEDATLTAVRRNGGLTAPVLPLDVPLPLAA
ncbi:MAG: GNAT family N-acetyltransferase [Bosea sp.]|uniref:acyl-homoserine-lactone synthase n=1 Tax=Bosea sp. (in: a-proteobacteria) TaxID=1871050 RepID=UPI0023909A02|nr:GNAT family N-acetyltransferase [Bosea sp. (in: a-proteobacteria)]MCP4739924.1 GNAT family N-acetyltransferase [Bosea sp. (in: a-proteobacteria)]